MDLKDFKHKVPDEFFELDDSELHAKGYIKSESWGNCECGFGLESWYVIDREKDDFDKIDEFYVLCTPNYRASIAFDEVIDEWQFIVTYLSKVKNL